MEESFRKSLFQVISLHTSTGFATDDYMQWSPVLWGCLTIIMLMGACAGSTTGGMKCIRMVILAKVSRNEFKHILHPNAVLPVRVNKQVISPSILSTVLAFCIYLCHHHHYQHTAYDGYGSRISQNLSGLRYFQYRKYGTGIG